VVDTIMKISKSEYFFLKFKLLKIRKLDCCKKKYQ
jgi:hypothetical protein